MADPASEIPVPIGASVKILKVECRSVKRKLKIEEDDEFEPEKLTYYGSDDQGDWFQVRWLGHKKKTFQLATNFGDDYRHVLKIAQAKGSDCGVPWTSCAGKGAVSETPRLCGGGAKRVCSGPLTLTVPFQDENQWCTLYSLLNVLGASKRKGKKARKTLGTNLCGFSDLAKKAAGVLKVSLAKVSKPSISWLLKQTSGKYLLMKGVHCISVDCEKNAIFDSAKTHVLELTRRNLLLSGFGSVDEMRKVVP
jgi:hypothetical protein